MPKLAKLVRRLALVLTWLVVLGGLSFALGYAFEDPGGGLAITLTVAVIGSLAGLTLAAVRAPDLAFTGLVVAVALLGVWVVVDQITRIVEVPVTPVLALVLAGPISALGQRQPTPAGWLLLGIAAGPLAVLVARTVIQAGAEPAGLGSLLATSTGVVVAPLVVLGALFLIAGWLGRRNTTRKGRPTAVSRSRPSSTSD